MGTLKTRTCTVVQNALTRQKATFYTGLDTQKTTQNHYTKKQPQKPKKTPKTDPKQTTPHQEHPQNTHHKNTKHPDKAKGAKTYTQTQHQKQKRTTEHQSTRHPLHYYHPAAFTLPPPFTPLPSTLSPPYLTLYYPAPCLAFLYLCSFTVCLCVLLCVCSV